MGRPKGSGGSSYGLRRRSSGSNATTPGSLASMVELVMECADDPLSSSQMEATRKAREEYRQALRQIEVAKAEAAKATAAAQAIAAVAKAAAAVAMTTISPPTASSAKVRTADADVMIVGETPARRGRPPAPGAPPPLRMAGAEVVVPQQVYQFTNHGQTNNWFLRPIMPVMPQQQVIRRGSSSSPRRSGSAESLDGPVIVSGTSGLGIKRPANAFDDFNTYSASSISKRPRGKGSSDSDTSAASGGNWVPLDEYYYGKMEGDPTYSEDKSEFRFKCWMCTKMLYNNVKAMMHLQGHIDSEKQQNLDLSDLTQCKHCYKQFDTPFEMQTHIEKVHLNNVNVLMCRICEKDHDSRSTLTAHMRQNHCACEMPYVCQLCNFRSSMYSDVVDHFKKKHDSSDNLLCLYCLRVFHVKFVSQGWGQTQVYYHHLLRHQSKTASRKCPLCKLSFFNVQDLKVHRKSCHQPNQKGVIGVNAKYSTPDQVMIKVPETGIVSKKSSCPKSLNAPAVSKVTEHRGLRLPGQAGLSYCFECKMLMNTTDHYKKYIQCSMCRFATSCSFFYAAHMMSFHSGQAVTLSHHVSTEKALPAPLYCSCGFASNMGNKIANHLVFCSKRTCYLEKPEAPASEKSGQDDRLDPRHRPGASILDVLGLVKKRSVVNTEEPVAVEEGAESKAETTTSKDWEELEEKRCVDEDSSQAASDILPCRDGQQGGEGSLDLDRYHKDKEVKPEDADTVSDQPSNNASGENTEVGSFDQQEQDRGEVCDQSSNAVSEMPGNAVVEDGSHLPPSKHTGDPFDSSISEGGNMSREADLQEEVRGFAMESECRQGYSSDGNQPIVKTTPDTDHTASGMSGENSGGQGVEGESANVKDQRENDKLSAMEVDEDNDDYNDSKDQLEGVGAVSSDVEVTCDESRPKQTEDSATQRDDAHNADSSTEEDQILFVEPSEDTDLDNKPEEVEQRAPEGDSAEMGIGKEGDSSMAQQEGKTAAVLGFEPLSDTEQEGKTAAVVGSEPPSDTEQEGKTAAVVGSEPPSDTEQEGKTAAVVGFEPLSDTEQEGKTSAVVGSEPPSDTEQEDKTAAVVGFEPLSDTEQEGKTSAVVGSEPPSDTEQEGKTAAVVGSEPPSDTEQVEKKEECGIEELQPGASEDTAETGATQQEEPAAESRKDMTEGGTREEKETEEEAMPESKAESSEEQPQMQADLEGEESGGCSSEGQKTGRESHSQDGDRRGGVTVLCGPCPSQSNQPEDLADSCQGASDSSKEKREAAEIKTAQMEEKKSAESADRRPSLTEERKSAEAKWVGGSKHSYQSHSTSSDRDRYRDSNSRNRSYDYQHRDHSSSRSDHRDYDSRRSRDRSDYGRDHHYHDRYHHDRHRDNRYDCNYQQGSRDHRYDQNRHGNHGNRGGQNRHGYQDRNYHRGYY